jgi:hypothetical protein
VSLQQHTPTFVPVFAHTPVSVAYLRCVRDFVLASLLSCTFLSQICRALVV